MAHSLGHAAPRPANGNRGWDERLHIKLFTVAYAKRMGNKAVMRLHPLFNFQIANTSGEIWSGVPSNSPLPENTISIAEIQVASTHIRIAEHLSRVSRCSHNPTRFVLRHKAALDHQKFSKFSRVTAGEKAAVILTKNLPFSARLGSESAERECCISFARLIDLAGIAPARPPKPILGCGYYVSL